MSGLEKQQADYAGDVSVADAYAALRGDPNAHLVDVRSDAEWSFVGLPDLSAAGKQPARIAWQTFPGMKPNAEFMAQLAAAVPKEAPVYFLCRSGARSRAAAIAATKAGYAKAFNIAGGFEGDLDAEKKRGRVGGWKAAGLPWSQS
jgi:rhodanese-related sulfurtransferase